MNAPPPLQRSWDARAAANFVLGGAGAGAIVAVAYFGDDRLRAIVIPAALAMVGVGLVCVFTELGRPLRALHVFFHVRRSWMSRESLAAVLLFPAGIAAVLEVPGAAWIAAVLALIFLVCQARMLQAARGIPAWRAPPVAALIVVTGVVEGSGLLLAVSSWLGTVSPILCATVGALALLRAFVWFTYRRSLTVAGATAAREALVVAGQVLLLAGTAAPLALIAVATAGVGESGVRSAAALAGILALLAGAFAKFALIARAGFRQPYVLAHIPVRGTRR